MFKKINFEASKLAGFILGPSLFMLIGWLVPETFISPIAYKVLAVASWMIAWWITDAVPFSVTALLPLILFPLIGAMPINDTAAPYAHPIIFLFMGGFFIAIALEKHRLHERIALNLIKLTGTSGNGIIMGFMIATAFISMWISNTATAMMMMPIALSVIKLVIPTQDEVKSGPLSGERNFALGLMLTVGYAATLGGLATIIGTPPNVVFIGLLNKFNGQKISFGEWMLVGVPVSILLLIGNYLIVTKILFPNKMKTIKGSDNLITTRLAELGAMRKEEKLVLGVFLTTSFFWILQQFFNEVIFKAEILNDTNIAMAGGLLMFVIPVDLKNMKFILHWDDTKNMAWGVLILFGGGLCLAEGLGEAGIIRAVGDWIVSQTQYNSWFILLLIVLAVAMSEMMSNVALVNIFIPVIFGIAQGLNINPVLLALPVTLSASIGFMFPIATPPNAIVFSSGYIRIKDMVRAGILLNLFSILIIWIASLTLVRWVFG
jgi:solute carrier family 13 (sodium-dependent dicarboxylate transporter), member 2/3/5